MVDTVAWNQPLEKEPEVLKSEIRMAIKRMKNGKAVGINGITAEA